MWAYAQGVGRAVPVEERVALTDGAGKRVAPPDIDEVEEAVALPPLLLDALAVPDAVEEAEAVALRAPDAPGTKLAVPVEKAEGGPDAEGEAEGEGVALAHARLRVLQPLVEALLAGERVVRGEALALTVEVGDEEAAAREGLPLGVDGAREGVGVAPPAKLPLGDAEGQGVALAEKEGELLAHGEREGEEEKEGEAEARAEGEVEREAEGEGGAVLERVERPKPEGALAVAVPHSVGEREGGVLWLGEPLGLGETLGVREVEGEAKGEGEAVRERVSRPEPESLLLAVGVPQCVGEREGAVLWLGEPLGVGETLGEGEVEGEAEKEGEAVWLRLARPEPENLLLAVGVPQCVGVGEGVVLWLGEPLELGEALGEGDWEGEGDGKRERVIVREAAALPVVRGEAAGFRGDWVPLSLKDREAMALVGDRELMSL